MQDSMDLMPVVCSDKECYEDERRMVCISEEVRREQRRGARKRLKRPGGQRKRKEVSEPKREGSPRSWKTEREGPRQL